MEPREIPCRALFKFEFRAPGQGGREQIVEEHESGQKNLSLSWLPEYPTAVLPEQLPGRVLDSERGCAYLAMEVVFRQPGVLLLTLPCSPLALRVPGGWAGHQSTRWTAENQAFPSGAANYSS